jgi:hypothetical protein
LFTNLADPTHAWDIGVTAKMFQSVLCPALLAEFLSRPETTSVLESALVRMDPTCALAQLAACPDPTQVSDAVRLEVLSRLSAKPVHHPGRLTCWSAQALEGLDVAEFPLAVLPVLSASQRARVRDLLVEVLGGDVVSPAWVLFFEMADKSTQPVGDVLGMVTATAA